MAISLVAWSSTSDGPLVRDAIALRVGVGGEMEQHFAGVVHVHVGVHHHDVFGEHHLPHAPKAVHDFIGLERIRLLDAHEHQIVEHAFRWQRDVHDFGEVHLEDGQEEFHRRAADVEVFHRRDADDGGGINGVLAMRDGRDVKHRIRLGQCVIAGVIAKRPFVAQRLGRINVTFDDEVGVGGDFEIVRLALHEFDRFLPQITSEEKFIQAVRQRCGGGEGKHRVTADENGDRHALALFVITTAMTRGDFLQLPVHAGGFVVVNLDAIHAEIPLAGIRVARDHAR